MNNWKHNTCDQCPARSNRGIAVPCSGPCDAPNILHAQEVIRKAIAEGRQYRLDLFDA